MTFWDSYRRLADAAPDALAVTDQQGTVLTHGELCHAAEQTAAALAATGLGPGDHLGVFLPTRASWAVLALATARSGIGVLGLNTRFREAELNHLLAVAEVDSVVVTDSFLGIDGQALMAGLDRPVSTILDSTIVREVGDDHSTVDPGPPEGRADHPLIGFTTSGTTGFPKVAMHDQQQTFSHMRSVASAFSLSDSSVALVPLPFCGAFGYTVAMATLLAGGSIVLHETWDPDVAAAAIAEHGITFASASDDMLSALVASDRFVSPSTWTDGGFADFTNSGRQAVIAVEAAAGDGIRLTGLYGASEGFAMMSTWDRDLPQGERCRNGGYLVGPDMSVRCADPETGALLAHDEPGELQFQGPNLVTGYLNNPEATARAFTADGWYRSGDLGQTVGPDARGHGGFIYLARLGDTLRLRGFLCDPAEIEKHLENHPSVDLAQVVGVKRPKVGDVAVAFVRLVTDSADEPSTDEAELIEHCRVGLANYKRPERVLVVDEFPVTDGPNGVKIRKVDLRDRATELLG